MASCFYHIRVFKTLLAKGLMMMMVMIMVVVVDVCVSLSLHELIAHFPIFSNSLHPSVALCDVVSI
jgi:hypothetical protein